MDEINPKPLFVLLCLMLGLVMGIARTQARPFNEYVLLIDTSRAMDTETRWGRLKATLDEFADTIAVDGRSRIWLFPYDSGLSGTGRTFLLHDNTAKNEFKVTLQRIPNPRGRRTMTWTALRDVVALMEGIQEGESRSISIHLFTAGLADDSRSTFDNTLARFMQLRARRPELRLYYHAIDFEPPREVRQAAQPGSGIFVLGGIDMPPRLLAEQILHPESSHRVGVPQAWTGAAVGLVEWWEWDFGDGQTSKVQNPVHTYASSGSYRVTVRAGNRGGTDQRVFPIIVAGTPPRVDFSYSTAYAGLPTVFRSTSEGEITSLEWRIDKRIHSEDEVWEHPFSVPGSYQVSLEASGPGGSDIKIAEVRIEALPQALFSWVPREPVRGQEITFINESINLHEPWLWDFDRGQTSNERNARHTFVEEGRFTVRLSGRNPEGETSRREHTVVVVTDALPPKAEIAMAAQARPGPVLVGAPLIFRDASTGTINASQWDFGDGTQTTGAEVRHTFTQAGDFVVALTVSGPLGHDRASIQVSVGEPDWRIAVSPRPAWLGRTASFVLENAPSHLASLTWNFGDGTPPIEAAPGSLVEHQYTEEGDFTVTLTAALAGESADQPLLRILHERVTVHSEQVTLQFLVQAERAQLDFSGPRTLRGPVPLRIMVHDQSTGPIAAYAWDFGDGNSSDDRSPPHTYSTPGVHRLHLRVRDHLNRQHETSQGETFLIETTGWRPPTSWRLPAILLLVGGLTVGWRFFPLQFRRVRYEKDGRPRTHRSWMRNPTFKNGSNSATLRLRRTFLLRKYYTLEPSGSVEWETHKGERATRDRVHPKDTLKVGPEVYILRGLNHSLGTGVKALLVILLLTAGATWLGWSFFY